MLELFLPSKNRCFETNNLEVLYYFFSCIHIYIFHFCISVTFFNYAIIRIIYIFVQVLLVAIFYNSKCFVLSDSASIYYIVIFVCMQNN